MNMIFRFILCLIFPPLAVFDRGCGAMLLVAALTILGWLPGTIAAMIISLSGNKQVGDGK